MGEVLYRQYRPQTFAEVVNQDPIKRTLKNAVEHDSVAHAYLFTGPRGVGKTSLARILAKAINCLKPKHGEPCDECAHCTAIREGRFLDLIEIDAASNTGVDNIREVIEHVKFAPASGKKKIIVIDEVHMLSKGAFNALLKTLEEPPAHAVFILATTELQKVPATIISRTQRFDFKRLSGADIIPHLTSIAKKMKYKIPESVIALIARASEGSLRDALSLLDQVVSFTGGSATLEDAEDILGLPPFATTQEFLSALIEGGEAKSFVHIDSLIQRGYDMGQATISMLQYLQMVVSTKIRESPPSQGGLSQDDTATLVHHAKLATHDQLRLLMTRFIECSEQIRHSPIPELPVQLAVMDFFAQIKPESETGTGSPTSESADTISPRRNEPVETSGGAVASLGQTRDMRETIAAGWNEFLIRMREYNHSLISALKLASIQSCDGETLVISFPYKFHKEAVEQRKNTLVIETALQEMFGVLLKLKCLVAVGAIPDQPPTNQMPEVVEITTDASTSKVLLEEAIKVFGNSAEEMT